MCAWPSVTFKIYQYDVSTRRLSSSLRTSKTSSFRLSLLSWRFVTLLSPVCCSIISRYRVIPRLRTPEVEVVLKTKAGEIGSGCPDAEMEVGTGHTEFGTSLNGWWAEQTDTQMYEQSSNRYNSDIWTMLKNGFFDSLLSKCARDYLSTASGARTEIRQIPDNEFENGRVQVGFESRFPKLPRLFEGLVTL